MKKIIFMALFAFTGLLYTNASQAQVSLSINIGDQPAWAPVGEFSPQYYYIPEMDIYYDVPVHQFVYLSHGRWIRTSVLPAAYRQYDLYKVYKVPINRANAYKYHSTDKVQYAKYKGKYNQQSIRDSHDDKYKNNRDNWQNNRFKKADHKNTHDNGNHH